MTSCRGPPFITVCNGWAIREGVVPALHGCGAMYRPCMYRRTVPCIDVPCHVFRPGQARQRGHAGKTANCVSQVRCEQLARPTPCADGGAKALTTCFPQAPNEHRCKFALPWVSENTRWKTPREHQEINKVMKTRVALEICTSTRSTSCSSWHVHYTCP